MYIPPQYRHTDLGAIRQFVERHSFATVTSVGKDGLPMVTHIPMDLWVEGDQWRLTGHVARGNPQWKNLEQAPWMVAAFLDYHAYISPSWYARPNVPTWNYVAVHLSGPVRRVEGEELYEQLRQQMDKYEAHSKNPLHISDIPEKMLNTDLRGLVAFEMQVDRVECAHKLSQNRDDRDYAAIIAELEQSRSEHDRLTAEAMRRERF